MLAAGHPPGAAAALDDGERVALWRVLSSGQAGPLQTARLIDLLEAIARLIVQVGGGKPPRARHLSETHPDLWEWASGGDIGED